MTLTSKLESKRWVMTFTPKLSDDDWEWLAGSTDFWDRIFDENLRDGKGDYSLGRAYRLLPKYLERLGIKCEIVGSIIKGQLGEGGDRRTQGLGGDWDGLS